MTQPSPDACEPLQIEADVLIAGGGMAACWAGISAARSGAKVVLVDKGYVGTSGVISNLGLINLTVTAPDGYDVGGMVGRNFPREGGEYLTCPFLPSEIPLVASPL